VHLRRDDTGVAVRAAAVLFLFGAPAGVLNLALSADIRSRTSLGAVLLLDAWLLLVAVVLWRAPWHRLPTPALLAVPAVGSVTTIATDLVYHYTATDALVAGIFLLAVVQPLWIGWCQPRGYATVFTSLFMAPVLLYHAAVIDGTGQTATLLGLQAVAIAAGETVAWARTDDRRRVAALEQLLAASARLGSNVPLVALPAAVADAAREALGGRAAAVFRDDGEKLFVAAVTPGGWSPPASIVAEARQSPEKATQVTLGRRRFVIIPLPAVCEGLRAAAVEIHPREDRFVDLAAELLVEVLANRLMERCIVSELEGSLQTDPLTGVGNRALLHDTMPGLAAGAGLLVIDIDRFKELNDRAGHGAGDEVLCDLAAYLRRSVRADDTVIRLGGDEFLVVLRSAVESEEAIAQRIVEDWNRRAPVATISAGLARQAPDESSLETLKRADAALYRAKGNGRSGLCSAESAVASPA
jgi:diguanylate cyclase (GGDEF)-like protein